MLIPNPRPQQKLDTLRGEPQGDEQTTGRTQTLREIEGKSTVGLIRTSSPDDYESDGEDC